MKLPASLELPPDFVPDVGFTHVVATLGSAGDLHPFLAIARALREQGHTVLMLTQAPFQAEVQAQGLHFAPIVSAHDHHRTAVHPLLWHPLKGFGVLWRHLAVPAIAPTLAVLHQLMQRLPNGQGQRLNVLASPLVVGARLAQERWPERIRLTTGHTAPAGLRSCQDPMFLGAHRLPSWTPLFFRQAIWNWLDRQKLEPMAAPVMRRWRQTLELPVLHAPIFASWLHSTEKVLGFFPPDFGIMPSDWPVNPILVGFPLYESGLPTPPDAELTEFCSTRASPLIVVYPGSAPTQQTQRLYTFAQQLHTQGARCLILGMEPTTVVLPKKSPYWLQRPWVRLSEVIPQAGLFMHHGGIGACAQGLAAQRPQWAWPSAYDQFDNTWRLQQFHHQPYLSSQLEFSPQKAIQTATENSPAKTTTQLSRKLTYSTPWAFNTAVKTILQELG